MTKARHISDPIPDRDSSTSAEAWLQLSDAELLGQCRVETYRASGPGGQKRNKTSSAVRIRHAPTGLAVTATESRSQHENRARALVRLREAIALNLRSRLDPTAEAPPYVLAALKRNPGLRVNRHHPDYHRIVQYVLDLLVCLDVSTSRAAGVLEISTSQLIRFLKVEPKLLGRVNELRRERGLKSLS